MYDDDRTGHSLEIFVVGSLYRACGADGRRSIQGRFNDRSSHAATPDSSGPALLMRFFGTDVLTGPTSINKQRIATMNLLYQRIGGRAGIFDLLRHFYADVRQDRVIGPIFTAQIDDWKHHLEIIASFWETLTGGPRSYARRCQRNTSPFTCERSISSGGCFFDRQTVELNCRSMSP